jgi:hypothetical protein
LGLKVAWVGADLAPVGKLHTSNDLWQLVVAVKATPVFCAPSTSLNTMASAVLFDKHPFEGSSCVGRSRRCFRSDSTCVGVPMFGRAHSPMRIMPVDSARQTTSEA